MSGVGVETVGCHRAHYLQDNCHESFGRCVSRDKLNSSNGSLDGCGQLNVNAVIIRRSHAGKVWSELITKSIKPDCRLSIGWGSSTIYFATNLIKFIEVARNLLPKKKRRRISMNLAAKNTQRIGIKHAAYFDAQPHKHRRTKRYLVQVKLNS